MSKPLIFFGTEDFSATVLQSLIDGDYDITAVITKPDFYKGRGRKLVEPVVKKLAAKYNITVLQPQKLSEIIDFIHDNQPALGILVSYGKIIPPNIIALFTPGIINVHPSLLPKYRGPSPIETAILNDDPATGVSIMLLTAKMDAGPVYARETSVLTGTETKLELYDRLSRLGANLLIKILPDIFSGNLEPTPQTELDATYCPLLTKDESWLKPEQKNASRLEREIRAYTGYPKSRYILYGQEVIIQEAHIAHSNDESPIILHCVENTTLAIDQLIAPSGKSVGSASFLRGYRPPEDQEK